MILLAFPFHFNLLSIHSLDVFLPHLLCAPLLAWCSLFHALAPFQEISHVAEVSFPAEYPQCERSIACHRSHEQHQYSTDLEHLSVDTRGSSPCSWSVSPPSCCLLPPPPLLPPPHTPIHLCHELSFQPTESMTVGSLMLRSAIILPQTKSSATLDDLDQDLGPTQWPPESLSTGSAEGSEDEDDLLQSFAGQFM